MDGKIVIGVQEMIFVVILFYLGDILHIKLKVKGIPHYFLRQRLNLKI